MPLLESRESLELRSIECFIKDYIKKHELDIPPSDVPFLAKFIRLAGQREGGKYHAALKIKKN
jgi:hypothetical protein